MKTFKQLIEQDWKTQRDLYKTNGVTLMIHVTPKQLQSVDFDPIKIEEIAVNNMKKELQKIIKEKPSKHLQYSLEKVAELKKHHKFLVTAEGDVSYTDKYYIAKKTKFLPKGGRYTP